MTTYEGAGGKPREHGPHGSIRIIPDSSGDAEAPFAGIRDRVGSALDAYLTLRSVDGSSSDLEQDFHADYRGTFNSFEEAAQEQLKSLGWLEALTAMLESNGIPPEFVSWNLSAISDLMAEVYDIVHRNGRVYLFLK
ncbi:hypothetical protein IFU30_12510 [Plantibacter sp. CFBP 8798]|uniref:hypothetical protein n=1 Tax=Plantibacter sp. CFBP 8798 TaxID=2775268 RepID=UPI00177CA211|nr:hypothetical protein [Plantibacter sp. CFBP 8798]MBD8467092.1 hypothetical protein [Plantibacter sp. CFBP 8798]